ncbi:MAG: hypothetical protein FWG51_00640 [Firmicutes bacterium]|nr:hypothetical protein [Bacillota bacterium]
MKKIFKKVLKTEKSFETWAHISNVQLEDNEVDGKKHDKRQRNYLAFRNVIVYLVFVVILMPALLYVVNNIIYTPGTLVTTTEKPPNPPNPPENYSSKDVNTLLYENIDDLFDEFNNVLNVILFSDEIQNISQAYKETVKPSIDENEPVVSCFISECLILCDDGYIITIDLLIRLDSKYLFDGYENYTNLIPLEGSQILEDVILFYTINEDGIGYINYIYEGSEYFLKLYNTENIPEGSLSSITEERLQDFVASRRMKTQ